MNADNLSSPQSSRWLSFPLGLTLILILGLGLPVLGSAVSTFVFPEWQWDDLLFHMLIEILGGLAALSLGTLLLHRPHVRTRQLYYWIACGFIGMGILDMFHALVEVGETFVWLHSTATFVGGILFMVGWWEKISLPSHLFWRIPLAIGFASILFAALSWGYPDLVPLMVAEREFTVLAKGLNILGGLGFFVAATRFTQFFRKSGNLDEWLFAIHCTLFGSAGLLFEISTLWDAGWWWWHALRLVAYGTGLQCILGFSQFPSSNESPQLFLENKKEALLLAHPTKQEITWLPMIIVLVFVSSIVMGAMTFSFLHEHLLKKEGETLVVMASNVSQHLEQTIFERKGDIELLTKASVFQQSNTYAMSTYLQVVLQTYQAYMALSYVDVEGTILASTSLDLVDQNISDESILVSMRQTPRFHLEDVRPLPYFHQTLGLTLAAPVWTPEGQLQGLVLGHVGLSYLQKIFGRALQTHGDQDGHVSYSEWLMLTHDGTVIVDSVLNQEGLVNLQDLGLSSALLLKNGPAYYVKELHLRKEIPVITGYAQTQEIQGISGIHWGILVRKNQADVLASLQDVESRLGLIGMGIFLPLIGLLFLSVRRIQTAQARTSLALEFAKASETKNRLLLNSAKEGIWGLDFEGNTTFVNPAAAQMLGYDPAALLGKPMHLMVHHTRPDGTPYPREACPMYAAFTDGSVHQVDDEVLWRADGTSFPVEYTSTPIRDEHAQIKGAVVTFQDITDRKLAESSMHQYMEELQRSNQDLDDFAYIASHDLKEPLRGIFNYSTILLEDYGSKLNEDAQAKCQTLLRLSKRMEDLIDSLHYFSRAGQTELAKGLTDLQPILEEILDSLEVRLKECGVEIRVPRPLPIVHCDQIRVREILTNLITNAMKYNDKDEKWIEIGFVSSEDFKSEALSVKCEAQDSTDTHTESSYEIQDTNNEIRPASNEQQATSNKRPIFYIRDNGIGIREKHLPNIFRIFKRLHGRDKFGGGTGAGLTITKKLVERHGGSLWVESTYGEGTTFYFTLAKEEIVEPVRSDGT